MADFIPFRGIRYNARIVEDYSRIVAPPYDVIAAAEQSALHGRHPFNVIRLILGQARPDDNASENVHTRAAGYFKQWLREQVLVQDAQPGFYLTSISFDVAGERTTRHGIIGLVRLEPFEKGIVLPHERTFSKVKSERLRLMQACHANLCPIFGLYGDRDATMAQLASVAASREPEVDFVEENGMHHRLWHLTDQVLCEQISHALRGGKIYIADGHHRYETALNYREWIKARGAGFIEEHPCNYVMMSLISMEDPGLMIRPAHRLLVDIQPSALARLDAVAPEYFDIHAVEIGDSVDSAAGRVRALLGKHAQGNAVGVFAAASEQVRVMVLKPQVMRKQFGNEMHAALLDLDVCVLTRLIMMEMMGFDQHRLDDESKIAYCTDVADALTAVRTRSAEMCFLLNPTRMEQVRRVAENGLIMPRKSTYFYPKEISGLVMNTLARE